MPDPFRFAVATALAAGLLAIAGCTRHPGTATTAHTAPPQAGRNGTIVAVRPAVFAPLLAANVSLSILRAIGTTADFARSDCSGADTEFIIREDSGGTISVVQEDAERLHTGERVAVTGGTVTRVIRLSSAAGS
jgi:outer membrane lipoprotein SlyB